MKTSTDLVVWSPRTPMERVSDGVVEMTSRRRAEAEQASREEDAIVVTALISTLGSTPMLGEVGAVSKQRLYTFMMLRAHEGSTWALPDRIHTALKLAIERGWIARSEAVEAYGVWQMQHEFYITYEGRDELDWRAGF